MSRVSRDFAVPTDPEQELVRQGWRIRPTEDHRRATQGSQLRTRVLGGWFVRPRDLPKAATVRPSPDGAGFLVHATETLGFGLFDRRLRSRYEQAFDDLQRQLSGVSS